MISPEFARWTLVVWGAGFAVMLTVYLTIRMLEVLELVSVQPSLAEQPVRTLVRKAFQAGGEGALLFALLTLVLRLVGGDA